MVKLEGEEREKTTKELVSRNNRWESRHKFELQNLVACIHIYIYLDEIIFTALSRALFD